MDQREQRILRSKNYVNKAFRNLAPTRMMTAGSSLPMLKQQLRGTQQRRPPQPLPVVWPGPAAHQTPPASGLRVTWLGHSSLLIELDGLTILSDPVWAERLSPVPGFGPRRFHAPPIPLEQLPEPDLVLISHDHYDHLDRRVIRWLADKRMPFVTALGVGRLLERWGIAAHRIHELDWWDERELHALGLKLAAVPAQHFSGRMLRRNTSLWSSWVLLKGDHRIYIGCDSGMFSGFATIGERYGPFEFASLEMAQYGEWWPDVHMQPEQAIEAAQALRASVVLPVHWGTYCLSFHAWDEPIERMVAAAEAQGVALMTPRLGEPVEPAQARDLPLWWRDCR